ncbi:PREDICTED: uncharacterized protein LOC104807991 isoform X2 [Tarenaya hassleriana]|uniref:uncharacterized protein LOC104807991 isoform X2 n=1 Tax=Tarenaya hassleriana TaxID=28532 RepID=UPI00053C0F79|nr:PREDICTED: uncharacterized protein LOC104807991 isoform X2 [Tarenaya hassleriana]
MKTPFSSKKMRRNVLWTTTSLIISHRISRRLYSQRSKTATYELIVKEKATGNKVEGGHKQETSLESHKEDTTSQENQPYEETMPSPIHDTHIRLNPNPLSLTIKSNDIVFARANTHYISGPLKVVDIKEEEHEYEHMDVVLANSKEEAMNLNNEDPNTSEIKLFPSPQQNLGIQFISTRVCNLFSYPFIFSYPIQFDFFYEDNVCGLLSVLTQPLHEDLFTLSKHESGGMSLYPLVLFNLKDCINWTNNKEKTQEHKSNPVHFYLFISFVLFSRCFVCKRGHKSNIGGIGSG